ncbi:MAG: competence/damage-inducible protein A [Chloroflexi bacterium]|nr:competence/damage-inducible protein A [Chloroflexota bacterium]
MPKAEIITIGTEILLGEIVDTNSRYIARALRDAGVDLYWTSTVGDNEQRIAETIQQALARTEIIITTGGLGPTIDDPTRGAVARAIGVETEFRPELWKQVKDRFALFGRKPTKNNKRQAYVPVGSIAIENPVGTAPAFIVEQGEASIIALPGVPREMEHLMHSNVMPYLRQRYDLQGVIKARILHTAGVGESVIDERIEDLEKLSNPTVGLAAHAGQVDVRITAKADSHEEADAMIQKVEEDLRARLGDWLYGADEDTLEGAALDNMAAKEWKLVVVEAGLGGRLTQRFAELEGPFLGGEVLTELPDPDELAEIADTFRQARAADACLAVALQRGDEKQTLHLTIITPVKTRQRTYSYGGPPQTSHRWAVNLCLNFIRKLKI